MGRLLALAVVAWASVVGLQAQPPAARLSVSARDAGLAVQPSSLPSREELIQAVVLRDAGLRNFRAVTRTEVDDEVPDHHLHAEIAVLAPGRLLLDFAHGWRGGAARDAYWRHRSIVDGDTYLVEWPAKRAFESRKLKAEERLERFAVQPWLRGVAFWPSTEHFTAPRIAERSLALIDVVRDSRYRIGPAEDGSGHIELEWPGKDRIVLDPDRRYAVVRRDYFAVGNARLASSMFLSGFRRLGELWIPENVEIKTYYVDSDELVVRSAFTTRLEEFAVGVVTEADLGYEPGPGTIRLIRTLDEQPVQVVPGGLDFLIAIGDDLEASHDSARTPWFGGEFVFCCLVVVFAAAIGWLVGQRSSVEVAG